MLRFHEQLCSELGEIEKHYAGVFHGLLGSLPTLRLRFRLGR